jgi:hypothetical protein
VSRIFGDGTIVEMLYRPETRSTAFAVFRNGEWALQREIEGEDGSTLVPFSPENNLIKNEAVLLPSEPRDYGSENQLLSNIQEFLHRYVDLSPVFERVATYYVVLTWLYDAFNELPYLRLRGDFGTGKTRTLLTVGSICYKAFFASGASTVSPIFHTLDAFRGTLILDEADFRFSDERAEIVKILNNGNVRGIPVLRTMMNRQREFNPQAFQVFGPKIVAIRSSYDDKGLESRFLTEEMGAHRLRQDIPINMPESFKEEARELRNKLLLFRFHHRTKAKIDETLIDPRLEPRLNQILVPLLSIIEDESVREQLRSMAHTVQSDIVAERGLRREAQILEIVAELMMPKNRLVIPIAEIAGLLLERHGAEYDRPITNRWVGGILRRLNLRTYKSHGTYVLPAAERGKLDLLCARYGLEADPDEALRVQSGDVETLGT